MSTSEDSDLLPSEKETAIRWSKDEEYIHVHSDIASVVRRLLAHPEFTETSRRTVEGDVVTVRGMLPLGVLTIKEKPRKHGSHAEVVSGAVLREAEA